MYIASVVIVTGIIFSSVAILRTFAEPSSSIASSAQTGSGIPIHINIPKANVSATLEQIGLTSEGDLDTPKDATNAGWYKLGTRPGDIGSAVIDGHFSWYNNVSAVFKDLHLLQIGDKISILDSNGATTTFIVQKTQIYDPNSDASSVFTSTDGKAHLNIITCEGTWDKVTQTYSGRLVVFADKE